MGGEADGSMASRYNQLYVCVHSFQSVTKRLYVMSWDENVLVFNELSPLPELVSCISYKTAEDLGPFKLEHI